MITKGKKPGSFIAATNKIASLFKYTQVYIY